MVCEYCRFHPEKYRVAWSMDIGRKQVMIELLVCDECMGRDDTEFRQHPYDLTCLTCGTENPFL